MSRHRLRLDAPGWLRQGVEVVSLGVGGPGLVATLASDGAEAVVDVGPRGEVSSPWSTERSALGLRSGPPELVRRWLDAIDPPRLDALAARAAQAVGALDAPDPQQLLEALTRSPALMAPEAPVLVALEAQLALGRGELGRAMDLVDGQPARGLGERLVAIARGATVPLESLAPWPLARARVAAHLTRAADAGGRMAGDPEPAARAVSEGRLARAIALADDALSRDPACPASLRARAVAQLLSGRPEAALRDLDRLAAGGGARAGDEVWRAEAYWRAGDDGRARAELARVVEHTAHSAAMKAALAGTTRRGLAWIRWRRRSEVAFNGLFASRTAGLVPAKEVDRACRSRAHFRAFMQRLLLRMHSDPTFVLPPSSRDESVAQQRRIENEDADGVLAGFAGVRARHPRSPHPWLYEGELLLWLGRYEEARRAFEEGLSREPARWGYVGLGAASMLQRKMVRARWALWRATVHFPAVEGATTPAYLGAWLRRAGRPARAARVLEQALSARPQRVGAWLELALARLARGERDAAGRALAEVARRAPALWHEVRRDLGGRAQRALAEEALWRMRGNRGSSQITWLGPGGEIRRARDIETWSRVARDLLPAARAEVEVALASALAATS